jgi:hypothetical protein
MAARGVNPEAGPQNPKNAYIVFGEDARGGCALRYKTLKIRAKQNGQIRFVIVNDCQSPTASIALREVGGQSPSTCVDRTTPGVVGRDNEGVFIARVHPRLEVHDTCDFEIHAGEQKIDPQIVIIP